jgi:hypothetical protein
MKITDSKLINSLLNGLEAGIMSHTEGQTWALYKAFFLTL